MIIYGFMNYAFFSQDRDWKGARSTVNKYIGSAKAPAFMQKYNVGGSLEHQYASLTCVRYVEHMLGLSPKSIKWPYGYIAAEEQKLKSSATGIFDPNYAKANAKDIGLNIPPFNNPRAKLLAIDLGELNSGINFDDITQFKNHKAYVLLVAAAFMALGNRMFFEVASNPSSIGDYDEVKLYKLIMRSTKLVMSGSPRESGSTTRISGRNSGYMLANVLDFTPVLINSYHNLTQTHPNLHIDDISKLAEAVSKFVKTTRLVHT